jgi:hypothetical protein
METIISTNQRTIVNDLANAIASFNPIKVAELLSDKGEFNIIDENGGKINSDKANFIEWLTS